ncbi:MAG: AI-2E family transporter [Prevotellaceae bacterium]|jgi:predicted PurR-regulated permease PerM|nr:AI-2E family transporter [Prevotellaceae bacterium]
MPAIDHARIKQAIIIAVILIFGITIIYELRSFMSGILGAVTLYVLLRSSMLKLTEKYRWTKAVASIFLIIASVLLILIPLGAIVRLLYTKLANFEINTNQVHKGVIAIVNTIEDATGIELMSDGFIAEIQNVISGAIQVVLNTTYSLAINAIMLCFLLYFMLTNVRKLDRASFRLLPLTEKHAKRLVLDSKKMVVSNAVGIPLIAVVQGMVAALGYWVFGVSDPIFWGLITGVFGILPVVGTTIIWLPMGVYMMVEAEIWQGIGLIIFGTAVITSIDNFIRFILQKKMADVHPVVTVLGVIIGINLFGFIGLIFGPLLLSTFLLLVKLYRYEYMNVKESHIIRLDKSKPTRLIKRP